jgi:hypothetical protein
MAEIPIERKKGTNWLPILGALLALLLLGFCYLRRDRGAAPATGMVDTTAAVGATTGAAGAAGATGGAVEQFVQFVAARDTSAETEANHQYTATGVRLLASALDELAAGGSGGTGGASAVDIRAYADSMRRSVDRLQQSSANDRHADDARAAFNAAVSAMTSIDKARGRTADAAPMRAIARELSPQRPLVPQLGVVHRFFEAARTNLQQMRGTA